MRRAFLALVWGLILLLFLSGMARAAEVPVADVLRGPYEMPMATALMPSTADVLRGVYDMPVVTGVIASTADVLRGSYAAPPTLAVVPPTADILRGAYEVAPLTFGVQSVPLADVLRGPYALPMVATPWYFRTDVMFSAFAVILLLIAALVDYLRHRHPPVAGGFQPPRPSHVH